MYWRRSAVDLRSSETWGKFYDREVPSLKTERFCILIRKIANGQVTRGPRKTRHNFPIREHNRPIDQVTRGPRKTRHKFPKREHNRPIKGTNPKTPNRSGKAETEFSEKSRALRKTNRRRIEDSSSKKTAKKM